MNTFKPDGEQVFVQIPDETGKRVLHPVRHQGTEGDRLSLELECPLELSPEQPLFLYYELRRKFMQQPACVVECPSASVVIVETTADAILAESRESYRCPTLVEDIVARVGAETGCKVLDVSQTGLAVMCNTTYAPGSQLDVSLRFEGETTEGRVVVQSIQVPPGGCTRYGLRVTEGPLLRALPTIAMGVQRNQLRRRSGG